MIHMNKFESELVKKGSKTRKTFFNFFKPKNNSLEGYEP